MYRARSAVTMFQLCHISAFLTKYCYVILLLLDSVAADVDDLLELFRNSPIETLKRRLLERYGESNDNCFIALTIPVATADMKLSNTYSNIGHSGDRAQPLEQRIEDLEEPSSAVPLADTREKNDPGSHVIAVTSLLADLKHHCMVDMTSWTFSNGLVKISIIKSHSAGLTLHLTIHKQLGITAAHGSKKTAEYLAPLWRPPTSQQCHKAGQIPDSEPQPLHHAVERPDALLERRPDLRLSADPGEHAVWSAERRENIRTFYSEPQLERTLKTPHQLFSSVSKVRRQDEVTKLRLHRAETRVPWVSKDVVKAFEEVKETPVNMILLSHHKDGGALSLVVQCCSNEKNGVGPGSNADFLCGHSLFHDVKLQRLFISETFNADSLRHTQLTNERKPGNGVTLTRVKKLQHETATLVPILEHLCTMSKSTVQLWSDCAEWKKAHSVASQLLSFLELNVSRFTAT
ncbi:hypothetical protein T10_11366 [Trichinella papuae]|uniref:Uncharacterized protein n=1 Tax=Trichinella papuae TaxID=268474 RepID=A0A0V1M2N0_9BILA|nr:hypothetical protein T10_11366 [Trichinella papuae]